MITILIIVTYCYKTDTKLTNRAPCSGLLLGGEKGLPSLADSLSAIAARKKGVPARRLSVSPLPTAPRFQPTVKILPGLPTSRRKYVTINARCGSPASTPATHRRPTLPVRAPRKLRRSSALERSGNDGTADQSGRDRIRCRRTEVCHREQRTGTGHPHLHLGPQRSPSGAAESGTGRYF